MLYVEKNQIITVAGGHSGHFGSRGNGYKEEELTHNLAIEICKKLNNNGYKAINVSPTGSYTTADIQLKKEVENANKYNTVLHLCLHFNAFDKKANGTETWITARGGRAEVFASQINTEIVKIGFVDRGVKVSNKLYIPKMTKSPCCLVECCFIDSLDMEKYDINKMSNAIIIGICGEYWGKDTKIKYKVICGTFNNKQLATTRKTELIRQGIDAYILYVDNFYKVVCGSFRYIKNAEIMCLKLRNLGYNVEITQ